MRRRTSRVEAKVGASTTLLCKNKLENKFDAGSGSSSGQLQRACHQCMRQQLKNIFGDGSRSSSGQLGRQHNRRWMRQQLKEISEGLHHQRQRLIGTKDQGSTRIPCIPQPHAISSISCPTMDCTYEDLRHNEACVGVTNAANKSRLWLYSLSADCDACPYTRLSPISTVEGPNLTVDTSRWQTWRIVELGNDEANEHLPAAHQKGVYCELTPDIGQYGIYELKINNANECDLLELRQPVNPYTTLAVTAGAVVVLLSLLSILKNISACIRKHRAKRNGSNDEDDEESRVVLQPKRRIRSIDTIRGMSILAMIFVNNGAGGYVRLEHATWNGLAAGDLVFPCFMWIMGVCIPLSISSQLSPGRTSNGSGSSSNNKRRYSVCLAIVKRSLYLFFIGLSLNTLGGQTQLENIRIFGVLQRFAVAYLFVGIIYASMYRMDSKNLSGRLFGDVLILLPQWFVALAVLAAHCAITFLLQVPGCPKYVNMFGAAVIKYAIEFIRINQLSFNYPCRGYLGPGGYHEEGKYFECAGGATGYIDELLLGRSHVYQHPTIDRVYESGPFDPEGILGCLTSIFQVFLGVQSGQILREHKSWKARVSRWLSWACILGVVGAALHYTHAVPVNKNLWSISFALVTTSFSLVLLSISYLLVDAAALWNGGPFRIPGMNALVMYCGHQVFYAMFPFHWQYGRMDSHHGWLLAESLWCCSLWICIAYLMHRRKIYVTL
ncbi:unnamed protein product [Trichogramma brassicae]|uniref:Heparan-alpha-glucosaminide N-acetyltransferase catalytic domain-containing protein n=1 Tax=Trichogramma brassicae TaxID=86971 RepID=A0A6H5IK08_9HYME|nr:unnamed protein product [Trichogramma brassicae]